MNFISLSIKQSKLNLYSLCVYTIKLDHKNYTTQWSRHQNHGDSTNEQTARLPLASCTTPAAPAKARLTKLTLGRGHLFKMMPRLPFSLYHCLVP